LALLPKCTEQVSQVLTFCHRQGLKVVIQGGNTGLVAGAVPVQDEIVINLRRMNRILQFDDLAGVLQCEAGCILQTLDDHVNRFGYRMPLDLGAKGSCHIGGNLATNAGGLRVIRYGSLHDSCLGLEVVLADGRVLDLMNTLRKDNTGYDLKQLFVGSEGTLGVITQAAILCPPAPRATLVGVLSHRSFDRLLEVFRVTRQVLSEQLSAFEMMDQTVMRVSCDQLRLSAPFEAPMYTLIETAGGNADDLERRFDLLLETLEAKGLLENGTYSADLGTMRKLWSLRERVAEALLSKGYCFKYDLSLPLAHFYEPVEALRRRLASCPQVTSVSGYGHVGDSNLHLTVTCDEYDEQLHRLIEPYVYELTQSYHGSVSAEHGLGLKKNDHVQYTKSESAIELMKQVKTLLDPNCVLNPDKMFRIKSN
jgi:D-2-hydroxyglutarate dehydrogenase